MNSEEAGNESYCPRVGHLDRDTLRSASPLDPRSGKSRDLLGAQSHRSHTAGGPGQP
jgi:hypothetical protein